VKVSDFVDRPLSRKQVSCWQVSSGIWGWLVDGGKYRVWQQSFGDSEVAVLTNRVECKKQIDGVSVKCHLIHALYF